MTQLLVDKGVARYSCRLVDSEFHPDPGGAWVRIEDYEALRRSATAREDLLKRCREFMSIPTRLTRDYYQEERWDALQAELDAILAKGETK